MKCTRLLTFACIALMTHLAGCDGETVKAPPTVRTDAQRGPLRLTVSAGPPEVRLGDPIDVVVTMRAPTDYDVEMPEEADFGDLAARLDESVDRRPATEGGLIWVRRFSIRRYAAGAFELPALEVPYSRAPEAAQGEPGAGQPLISEPLQLRVRSALTTQDSVAQPRDIAGPVVPPPTLAERMQAWLLPLSLLAGVVVAALIIGVMWARRRQQAPAIAPEIWALRVLAQLRPQEVEADRARPFYYQLSEIVRTYIERKFGVAAPDMTTEEFLSQVAGDRAALPCDTERLREFMETCDIVKYAAFKPRREDAEHALDMARAFVHETAAAAAAAERRREAAAEGGQAA